MSLLLLQRLSVWQVGLTELDLLDYLRGVLALSRRRFFIG